MSTNQRKEVGLSTMCRRHQRAFRIPENLNHYSAVDLKQAERKYIKWALANGSPEIHGALLMSESDNS